MPTPCIANVIDCAFKISGLSDSEARAALCDLLASNPSIVLKHFNLDKKKTKTTIPAQEPEKLYKVVICQGGNNKINLIKFVRELLGLGLADAKGWVEGKSPYINGIGTDAIINPIGTPPGILGSALTLNTAHKLLARAIACGSGYGFQIVANNAEYRCPLTAPTSGF
jgi:hypothetical protein